MLEKSLIKMCLIKVLCMAYLLLIDGVKSYMYGKWHVSSPSVNCGDKTSSQCQRIMFGDS